MQIFIFLSALIALGVWAAWDGLVVCWNMEVCQWKHCDFHYVTKRTDYSEFVHCTKCGNDFIRSRYEIDH